MTINGWGSFIKWLRIKHQVHTALDYKLKFLLVAQMLHPRISTSYLSPDFILFAEIMTCMSNYTTLNSIILFNIKLSKINMNNFSILI